MELLTTTDATPETGGGGGVARARTNTRLACERAATRSGEAWVSTARTTGEHVRMRS
jgi:hypothetical protein